MSRRRPLVVAAGLGILAFGACGRIGFDDLAQGNDAGADGNGNGDAAPADPDAPAVGTLAITYHPQTDALPVFMGSVVWSNAVDGSVLDVTSFDTSFEASLTVENGGTVSAYVPDEGVMTYFGIAPGDALSMLSPPAQPCLLPGGAATFEWTAFSGATRYEMDLPCTTGGGASTSFLLPVPSTPLQPLVRAYSASSTLLGTTALPTMLLADGDVYTFPATWDAPVSTRVGVTNVPSSVVSVDGEVQLSTGDIAWHNAGLANIGGTPVGGEASLTLRRPALATHMSAQATLVVALGVGGAKIGYRVLARDVPTGLVSATSLPGLPSAPALEADAHTVSWSIAPGADADVLYLVSPPHAPVGPWFVVAPPGTTRVKAPLAPTGVPVFLHDDSVFLVVTVARPDVPGYAAARALADGRLGVFFVTGGPRFDAEVGYSAPDYDLMSVPL